MRASREVVRAATHNVSNTLQACLPFPVGVVALKCLEWGREWRWFAWQLPAELPPVRNVVHDDMRRAFLTAVRAGVMPHDIGTDRGAALAADLVIEAPAEVPCCGKRKKPDEDGEDLAKENVAVGGGGDADNLLGRGKRVSLRRQ